MRSKRALLIVLLLSRPAQAADLPELVLPQGVGVNIHFTRGHEKDLDLIAAAGFKVVRMDFAWAATERKKGEFDWSAYEELTASLEKRRLRAVYILDYSNALYETTVVAKNPAGGKEHRDLASPQHAESVAAFARWAAAAARHFHKHRIIWEIWNEPNIGFWKPKPDVGQYVQLALATCKAIRAADPQATLVAPATSGVPLPFLESCFTAGLLEHLDAVSVHPYRPYDRPPETAAEDYRQLRQLIERYAPSGRKSIPVLSGEWGYASHDKGVSLETQAAYLARQQLTNLFNGVPLSVWYDWKDDGTDPGEREHHFGTVTHDLKPKPAYAAVQTLTRELAGCRIVRRLAAGGEKDIVLLLTNPAGDRKFAAWTLGDPHAVTIEAGPGTTSKVTGATAKGEAFAPKVVERKLVLDLTGAPQYVTVKHDPCP